MADFGWHTIWRDLGLIAAFVAVVAMLPWSDWRAAGVGETPAAATSQLAPAAVPPPGLRPSRLPPPTFDIVRASGAAGTLVAGRAVPGARVDIVVDGETRAQVEADRAGHFVAFVPASPSQTPQVIWLVAETDGGLRATSADSVVVAAPPPPDPAPVLTAARDADAAPDRPELPDDPPAPRLLVAEQGGARLLDAPPLDPAETLRIDTLDYAADGAMVVTGRARAGLLIALLLDGREVGSTRAGDGGVWQARLDVPGPGRRDLDVRARNATGAVVGQVGFPIRRADPQALRARLEDGGRTGGARAVTVQPGMTLWAIARERYGDGTRYVMVVDANRARIDDPDLIYPGQIFDLPPPSGTE